jgi:DNA-binding response OmpR family regulator
MEYKLGPTTSEKVQWQGDIACDRARKCHRRILLICRDDDPIRESVSDLLSESAYEIVSAESDVNGIELFSRLPFDLVITGFKRPEITWRLAANLKAASFHTPILLITDRSREEVMRNASEGWIDFMIFGSFQTEELRKTIQVILHPCLPVEESRSEKPTLQ